MTPVQSSSIEGLLMDMWAELEASRDNQAPKRCVVRPHSNVLFVSELSTVQKAEAGEKNRRIDSCGRCDCSAAIGTRLTTKSIGFESLRRGDELAGALPECKSLPFGFLPH